MIWLADSIYATTPFIELIQAKKDDNFIFRIKQGDHKNLYECIDNMQADKHENTDSIRIVLTQEYCFWFKQSFLDAAEIWFLVNQLESNCRKQFFLEGLLMLAMTENIHFPNPLVYGK